MLRKERAQRKKIKEEGKEHQAKKRKKIVEDHHDVCGDDLSSLRDESLSGLAYPDLLHEVLLLKADESEAHARDEHEYGDIIPQRTFAMAVGLTPPEAPAYVRDVDGSLVRPPLRDCEACSLGRDSTDVSHNRTEGRCRYPHVAPQDWSKCPGCRGRKHRTHEKHTNIRNECKWGTQDEVLSRSPVQRDPIPMPSTGPAVTTAPRDSDGIPWGTAGENAIAEHDTAQTRSETMGTLAGSSDDIFPRPADVRAPPKPDITVIEDDDLNESSEDGSGAKQRQKDGRRYDTQMPECAPKSYRTGRCSKLVRWSEL